VQSRCWLLYQSTFCWCVNLNADDLVIIAPTASALRRLLVLCENYAREYCISFNVLKSKCLAVVAKNHRAIFEDVNDCVFYIDGKPIEFVRSFSHLGHLISSELNDDEEIINRKTAFIGQVNNTLCYFGKLTPLLNLNYFNPIVLVIIDVSYGHYQIKI